MLDHVQPLIAAGAGAVAVLTAVIGWLRWIRPKARAVAGQVVGVRDSILGREAIVDTITGRELSPALPGVGVRLAEHEKQMTAVTSALTRLADTNDRLANHEGRIGKLEEAAVERVVTKAESAAAWRAMEAAANAAPPEDAPTD